MTEIAKMDRRSKKLIQTDKERKGKIKVKTEKRKKREGEAFSRGESHLCIAHVVAGKKQAGICHIFLTRVD